MSKAFQLLKLQETVGGPRRGVAGWKIERGRWTAATFSLRFSIVRATVSDIPQGGAAIAPSAMRQNSQDGPAAPLSPAGV